MINRKIIVIMPAYNTESTLEKTFKDMHREIIDEIILIDDGSADKTAEIAYSLGIQVIKHQCNQGYGAVQKTGYLEALNRDADIVVLLHSDYQYDPKIIPKFIEPIANGVADVITGTRMLKFSALKEGMPWWKYIAIRLLTKLQNSILNSHISDFHNGYWAYSRNFLESVPFLKFSDKFDFDTDILIQAIINNFKIIEIPHRTRYLKESSKMSFKQGIIYGSRILLTLSKFKLHQWGAKKDLLFEKYVKR